MSITYYRWDQYNTKQGEISRSVTGYLSSSSTAYHSTTKFSIVNGKYSLAGAYMLNFPQCTYDDQYPIYRKYFSFDANTSSKIYYGASSDAGLYYSNGQAIVTGSVLEYKIGLVKSSRRGYQFSESPSTYPDGGVSGSYWYESRTTVESSSAPAFINVGTPVAKKSLTISWGEATEGSHPVAGYILTRNVNGSSQGELLFTGEGTTYTDTVEDSWNTVVYKVRAYDQYGLDGEYTTSETLTVIHNAAPTIDGTDSNLGTFSTDIPSVSYTVNDADGNTVTVTVSLDGTTVKTHTVTLGQANTFTFTAEEWRKILNGIHTIKLTADDGQGAIAVRQYTFTKNVSSMSFTLETPLNADDMITKALEILNAVIPDGATLTVEVCNNGYDDSPTWQDVTSRVLNGQKFFLENTEKTADKWGYNVRVTVDRNGATGDCYISGIAGFFE